MLSLCIFTYKVIRESDLVKLFKQFLLLCIYNVHAPGFTHFNSKWVLAMHPMKTKQSCEGNADVTASIHFKTAKQMKTSKSSYMNIYI